MYMYEPMTVPGLNIICTCGLAEQDKILETLLPLRVDLLSHPLQDSYLEHTVLSSESRLTHQCLIVC